MRRLLERFSALKLALPPDQLPWRPSLLMRALRSLPVQYEVRQGFVPRPGHGVGGEAGPGEGGQRPPDIPADGDRRPGRSSLWTFLRRLRGGRRDDRPIA
ncbi:hypothetical protein AB0O28_08055 [Microbispora sp. NPDC088329]|uniref:hypothetical protein n=1 Tax=Microbispora sp. NPDC088329 TaxID=3154869 RepID=UPI00344631DF